jgi:hypothetical protein
MFTWCCPTSPSNELARLALRTALSNSSVFSPGIAVANIFIFCTAQLARLAAPAAAAETSPVRRPDMRKLRPSRVGSRRRRRRCCRRALPPLARIVAARTGDASRRPVFSGQRRAGEPALDSHAPRAAWLGPAIGPPRIRERRVRDQIEARGKRMITAVLSYTKTLATSATIETLLRPLLEGALVLVSSRDSKVWRRTQPARIGFCRASARLTTATCSAACAGERASGLSSCRHSTPYVIICIR